MQGAGFVPGSLFRFQPLPPPPDFEGCPGPSFPVSLTVNSTQERKRKEIYETNTLMRTSRRRGPVPPRPGRPARQLAGGREIAGKLRLCRKGHHLCPPPGTAGRPGGLEHLVGRFRRPGGIRGRLPLRRTRRRPPHRQRQKLPLRDRRGGGPDLRAPAPHGGGPGRGCPMGPLAGGRGGDLPRRGTRRHGLLLALPHYPRRERRRGPGGPDRRGQRGFEPGVQRGLPRQHPGGHF